MGLGRVELPTSPLSGVRSSRLSYRPVPLALDLHSSGIQSLSKLDSSAGSTGSKTGIHEHPLERARAAPRSEAFVALTSELPRIREDLLLRKEVIQPQVPLRLPCYDFTPVTGHTMDGYLPCGLAYRLPVQLASMV